MGGCIRLYFDYIVKFYTRYFWTERNGIDNKQLKQLKQYLEVEASWKEILDNKGKIKYNGPWNPTTIRCHTYSTSVKIMIAMSHK